MEKFKDTVFALAKKKGFDEAEIYYSSGSEFQLSSLRGEIDSYNDATSIGVYFRGLKSGKIGAAFAEELTDETASMLVDEAFENYSIASGRTCTFTTGRGVPMFEGFSGAFSAQPVEEKIERVIALERSALEYDKRIIMAPTCRLGDSRSEVFIVNTLGLDRHYSSDGGVAVVVALAGEGNSKKTGFTFTIAREPGDIDVSALGKEASRAIDQPEPEGQERKVQGAVQKRYVRPALRDLHEYVFGRERSKRALHNRGQRRYEDRLGTAHRLRRSPPADQPEQPALRRRGRTDGEEDAGREGPSENLPLRPEDGRQSRNQIHRQRYQVELQVEAFDLHDKHRR